MTTRRPARRAVYAAGIVLLTLTGCGGVNRRFVVESNVPNAQVYIDGKPVGAAPAHATFEYYGFYNIELVHPDYERKAERVHVVAPWYAYPPFDFLAEVVWPFRVQDVRRYYFNLQPAQRAETGELIQNADQLRERGWNLPVPPPPTDGRTLPRNGREPAGPAPAELPPPAPLPGPAPGLPPVVPSVRP